MPQFAANLTMLFNEHPFLDRFEAAAKAGFKAVEFLFPYAYPVAELQARLKDHDLKLVLHNLPAGDWDAGDRGMACHPDRVDEFRAGVARGDRVRARRWACRSSTAWPARRRPASTTPRCAAPSSPTCASPRPS